MLNNSNYSLLPFTEYTALIYFLPQTKKLVSYYIALMPKSHVLKNVPVMS